MIARVPLALVALAAAVLPTRPAFATPEEPIRIGAVVATPNSAYEVALRETLGQTVSVVGHPLELLVEPAGATEKELKEAIVRLDAAGALVMVGPLDAARATTASKTSAARRLPHLRIAPTEPDVAASLAEALVERLRTRRIGFVTDGAQPSKRLARALAGALRSPYAVSLTVAPDVTEKDLGKRLQKSPVDVFVIDAEPGAARATLDGAIGACGLPTVLTPRATGDTETPFSRATFAVLGRSPATFAGAATFLVDWRKTHGEPAFGVGEGVDAAKTIVGALGRAESLTRDAVGRALEDLAIGGARGPARTIVDERQTVLAAPLAIWRLADGATDPYLPPPLSNELLEKGTSTLRDVDPTLGVPFGAWRSDRFALEEKTQWVVFSFGEPGESTIDEDLRVIGLSTSGAAPLVDHLVKEELLARLLAINSTLFLRAVDGTAIPGKSLRISFATHFPEKAKKGKAWTAIVAGDDEFAGGRAYPGQGRAEIYSRFIRRTIYEAHALDPPVGAGDLPYLDGSYRFGTDRKRDLRSELIRSLINAYSGSMALTAAHEIGHLAGLGHITEDPVGIMNVEEGAGIDHADGHFCVDSMEKLTKRLGVEPE